MDAVEDLHRQILACRRCQEAGTIEHAAPVLGGAAGNRIMSIGQAPGITEHHVGRGFAGRSGRVFFRWMASIGIGEEAFRAHVYMTAITKCYPGRATSGNGDRRPSAREIALCRPWLERQIALIDPEVILLVGTLAIERYFPRTALADLIGRRFEANLDGGPRVLVPLPHPSGASRWLNEPANRELLDQALQHVRSEWERVVVPAAASVAGSSPLCYGRVRVGGH